MRLYVERNGEKIYLPPEATTPTRRQFSLRIGGYDSFKYKGSTYAVREVRAEAEWTNPAGGALVGGIIGALAGPAGAIIGALVGGAAFGSPTEAEQAKVKRFNES